MTLPRLPFPPRLRRPPTVLATLAMSLLFMLPAEAEVVFKGITSPAGINAWLVEDYAVPIVTIYFAFASGTTQDPMGQEGLTRLMTTLFDEGAGPLDRDAFQIALDDSGAEMGFAADADATHGSMRMLADQRDAAIALLKLAITQPRFDQNPLRVDYPLPQTSILMAYPSVGFDDPDYFAVYLLAQILGGDTFQSRLTSECASSAA